jgi:hypothetical protein
MKITAAQVKEIRTEFAKIKPAIVTLDGNRGLTLKEAVFALAPTLERMKKRGFDTLELAAKLQEKGIEVKPPTLARYLNEFRRGRVRKQDKPGAEKRAVPMLKPVQDRRIPPAHAIIIKPDTPDDEL